MNTKWIYGDPMTSGPYLCAIMGQDKPVLMYWQGNMKGGGYWNDNDSSNNYNTKEPNVLYYMKLDDIPMPEGW